MYCKSFSAVVIDVCAGYAMTRFKFASAKFAAFWAFTRLVWESAKLVSAANTSELATRPTLYWALTLSTWPW